MQWFLKQALQWRYLQSIPGRVLINSTQITIQIFFNTLDFIQAKRIGKIKL